MYIYIHLYLSVSICICIYTLPRQAHLPALWSHACRCRQGRYICWVSYGTPPLVDFLVLQLPIGPRSPDGSDRAPLCLVSSKAFALIWYRALTWYSSPARPLAALDVPLFVTRQQGSPSPACRQLSRARNACAGGSREHGTKLKHRTKLGRTLCYCVS